MKQTRGDARADMAHVFDSTIEAREKLHRAADRIRSIGKRANFEMDAEKLVTCLHDRVVAAVGAKRADEHQSTIRDAAIVVERRSDGRFHITRNRCYVPNGPAATVSSVVVAPGTALTEEEFWTFKRYYAAQQIVVL